VKIVEILTERIAMIIQLTDRDLDKMPTSLRNDFMHWIKAKKLEFPVEQLDAFSQNQQPLSEDLSNCAHVRFSQLFDMGLLKERTQVRIRLKQSAAKYFGCDFITKGIQISSKGTVIYDGEEFDKPSPLAAKINGSSVNGWEYIEIKRDGQWIRLDDLRKIWRNQL
jgi:hypothetical protein